MAISFFRRSSSRSPKDDGKKKQKNSSPSFISALSTWFKKLGPSSNDKVDWEELEDLLVGADVGLESTKVLIDGIKSARKSRADLPMDRIIFDLLNEKIKTYDINLHKKDLNVILLMGINGVGKTTTAAKLANWFSKRGHKVMLAACDTYRAAAGQQLKTWGDRLNIPVVPQKTEEHPGAGQALFHSIDEAFREKISVLIVDTAGRIHTRTALMDEMARLSRIIAKKQNDQPLHAQRLIVVDANTGQNAVEQARQFKAVSGVDGLVLSKWDSNAKGGIVITSSIQIDVPVAFVGIGERAEDLILFDRDLYLKELLDRNEEEDPKTQP